MITVSDTIRNAWANLLRVCYKRVATFVETCCDFVTFGLQCVKNMFEHPRCMSVSKGLQSSHVSAIF